MHEKQITELQRRWEAYAAGQQRWANDPEALQRRWADYRAKQQEFTQ